MNQDDPADDFLKASNSFIPASRMTHLNSHCLSAGEMLVIRHGASGVVRCLKGRVLLSLPGNMADYCLDPGMALAIGANPMVLIECCSDARIEIASSRAAARRIWSLSALTLLPLLGLASHFASLVQTVESAGAADATALIAACDPDYHQARLKAWQLGKGMLSPDGTVASNRVLAAYDRQHMQEACKP